MYLTDPTFQLFSAPLDENANGREKQEKLYKSIQRDPLIKDSGIEIPDGSIPIALRWTLQPKWGFPRKPFKIFRRRPKYSQTDLEYIVNDKPETVLLKKTIDFYREYYIILITCMVPKGQTLTLTPIGDDDVLMKAKAYKINGDQNGHGQAPKGYYTETVLFKAPFMTGIFCEGLGWVTALAGITMRRVLLAKDWELVQKVGLPFEEDQVGGQGYQGSEQGVVGHLTDAKKAALVRLKLGEKLFQPPPSIHEIDAQYHDLHWEFPKASDYLAYLEDDQLNLIKDCLENSNDFIEEKRQVHYKEKREIKGLHQSGQMGDIEPNAKVEIPVVAQSMLSVAHDNPASLGLGFGTFDFSSLNSRVFAKYKNAPVQKLASNILSNLIGVEYMVVAEYDINPDQKIPTQLWKPFVSKGSDRLIIKEKKAPNRILTKHQTIVHKAFIRQDLRRMPKKLKLAKKEIQGLRRIKWPSFAFAALNNEKPVPVKPEQLEAIGLRINRPEKRDGPWTQAVKIRWPKSAITHGSALVAGYKSNQRPLVLNESYPFNKTTYQNLLTPVQKNTAQMLDKQDIGKSILSATKEPVPFYGNEKHHYFVSALDVFGRWSNWSAVPFITKAPPPQQPGIMSMKLGLDPKTEIDSLPPDAEAVSCQLEIEFGWDWSDRSPKSIQIAGKFFDAGLKTPQGNVPNYFSLHNDDTSTPIIDIKFDQNNPEAIPRVEGPFRIIIVEQNEPSPEDASGSETNTPSNQLVRYKLIISKLTCDFPNGQPFSISYAAYIRGMERRREPLHEYSDWNPWEESQDGQQRRKKNYIARFDDPRPPAISAIPENVNFTALPDASKIARGELSWPAATNALGYHVWEANEIGVRNALKNVLTESDEPLLPLDNSFVDRATQLKNLFDENPACREACQKYFSRLNNEPLKKPKFELSLPGSSDVLSLYQVSSVNSANIESKKSNCSFFAVPRLNVPNPPMLQVRKHKSPDGNLDGFLIKTVRTSGKKPAGYRIFRVRKKYLADKLGMKGLPVYTERDAAWEDAEISLIDGTKYTGKQIIDKNVETSWRPYVYQAVAVGKEKPEEGLFKGISDGCPSIITFLPPGQSPDLKQIGECQHNDLSSCFELQTSAPFHRLELGETQITVFKVQTDFSREILGSFTGQETKLNSRLSLITTKEEQKRLPVIERKSENLKKELTNFRVYVEGKKARIIVRVTDPLGQFSEIFLEKKKLV